MTPLERPSERQSFIPAVMSLYSQLLTEFLFPVLVFDINYQEQTGKVIYGDRGSIRENGESHLTSFAFRKQNSS